jgi:16S rRNA (guanine(527)-N(7))-methyltransferase GidB
LTNDEIWFRSLAKKNGISITDIQLVRISRYAELLEDWNKSINLVSRKDVENIWSTHLLLSMAFLFKIEFVGGARVLDLGTGGGLPGIPMSIIRTDVSFVLLDSIRKKTRAVEEMVASLGLPNVSVVCSRAEDLNKLKNYQNTFDAVIARAVSGLDNLVRWGMPFLKKNATPGMLSVIHNRRIALDSPALITMKGGETGVEIERTMRHFPEVKIHSMDLVFKGSETLQNIDKKLILVENR